MSTKRWQWFLVMGVLVIVGLVFATARAGARQPVEPVGGLRPLAPGGGSADYSRALTHIESLERQLSAMQVRVADLQWLLEHVERVGDDLFLTGANLNIVNGEGATNTTNGLGNLIIGYNEPRAAGPGDASAPDAGLGADNRTGSHMLVLGTRNNYSGYGGVVAGEAGETSGAYASVLGGTTSVASGDWSVVAGGSFNFATGDESVVAGGFFGTSSGSKSTVSGGDGGTASGPVSGVFGGQNNSAESDSSAVCGGVQNAAKAGNSTVCGGSFNEAAGGQSTVCGGRRNKAGGTYSTVSGGEGNFASGTSSSVSGGEDNVASGRHCAVAGGRNNEALGFASLVSEGCGRRVAFCGGP